MENHKPVGDLVYWRSVVNSHWEELKKGVKFITSNHDGYDDVADVRSKHDRFPDYYIFAYACYCTVVGSMNALSFHKILETISKGLISDGDFVTECRVIVECCKISTKDIPDAIRVLFHKYVEQDKAEIIIGKILDDHLPEDPPDTVEDLMSITINIAGEVINELNDMELFGYPSKRKLGLILALKTIAGINNIRSYGVDYKSLVLDELMLESIVRKVWSLRAG